MTKQPAAGTSDASMTPVAMPRRIGASGWQRWLFPGMWLIYLVQTVAGVHQYSSGIAAVVGYLIVAVFATCYLVAIATRWTGEQRWFWFMYVTAFVLTAVETIFARDAALAFCTYLAVLTVAGVGRFTLHIVVAMAAVALFAPWLIPSWGGQLGVLDALGIVLVSLAMWGFFKVIRSNVELDAARAEVARLAAENERSRIARDLHDLLGHSLTTITVKAGLARRLAERGAGERAAAEITEVEELSRRTLSEVRAAVAGYRDVTVSGELASAREVLRAAGIEALLPGAVDIVDADAAEVFGWVVRESVTNVVRHSRASRCTIELGEGWIEIVDNGRGGTAGAGNGLTGLRERLEAVGGTIEARGTPQGWRVRARVAVVQSPSDDQAADTTTTVR